MRLVAKHVIQGPTVILLGCNKKINCRSNFLKLSYFCPKSVNLGASRLFFLCKTQISVSLSTFNCQLTVFSCTAFDVKLMIKSNERSEDSYIGLADCCLFFFQEKV